MLPSGYCRLWTGLDEAALGREQRGIACCQTKLAAVGHGIAGVGRKIEQ